MAPPDDFNHPSQHPNDPQNIAYFLSMLTVANREKVIMEFKDDYAKLYAPAWNIAHFASLIATSSTNVSRFNLVNKRRIRSKSDPHHGYFLPILAIRDVVEKDQNLRREGSSVASLIERRKEYRRNWRKVRGGKSSANSTQTRATRDDQVKILLGVIDKLTRKNLANREKVIDLLTRYKIPHALTITP